MKITNTQKGPRGLNAIGGPVLVEPGQTVDVELAPAEVLVARGTGWFEIEEVEPPAPKSDDTSMSPAELLAKVDELHFQTFKAEARKTLGDETPETKDAIVAALQAKV
jgi:hypothetical protein